MDPGKPCGSSAFRTQAQKDEIVDTRCGAGGYYVDSRLLCREVFVHPVISSAHFRYVSVEAWLARDRSGFDEFLVGSSKNPPP